MSIADLLSFLRSLVDFQLRSITGLFRFAVFVKFNLILEHRTVFL